MLDPEENRLLTRTDAGTPMGEYFRRFWHPVALSRELPAPDCAPLRIRIMGEDFIAFRDTAGKVGVLEPRCAHRGAELFFGRNEEGGLRCIYHGWKYDTQGRCVELPNVPPGASYHGKISIRACPTQEFGEIVWAYLGPADRVPEMPQLEFGTLPAPHRYVSKRLQQCNWAQSMEGALDTAHFSFLHMPAPAVGKYVNPATGADENRLRWLRDDPMPRFTIVEHEAGFAVGGSRRADDDQLYWRLTQFMLPSHSIAPSAMPGEFFQGYSWVPVSDEACWIYTYAWHPERPLSVEERARFEQGGFGQFAELGPGYVPLRNRGNDYLIDREEQKLRSFTGVRGIAEQDALAQDSQGLIVDRSREHLTATDVAVVRFRRLMLDAARALREGREPEAARRGASYRVRGGGAIAPSRLSFEEVMQQRFGSPTGRVQ